jgi:hypothetical protein
MSNYPEPVADYLKNFQDELETDVQTCNTLAREFEVRNFQLYTECLMHEIALYSLDSYNTSGTAELEDVSVIHRAFFKAATQYHIKELVEDGVVECVFHEGDIQYQLNRKRQIVGN